MFGEHNRIFELLYSYYTTLISNFTHRSSTDEIIRQVTINCAERGFLLSRIRDEIAMSMEAYETLYCSSAAFGIRKALQSQEGKEQLYQKVLDLQVSG